MLEIIAELETGSKELAGNLKDFHNTIEKISFESVEEVEAIRDHLGSLCKTISTIYDTLSDERSPIGEIITRVGESPVILSPEDVEPFLQEHFSLLLKIGLDPASINNALNWLQNDEDLTQESGEIDEGEIVEAVGEIRDQVCEIASHFDHYVNILTMESAKSVVDGAVGVCIVAVDITGAFTVPDPTAFTFIKAVKSTLSGTKKIRNAVSKLRSYF